MTDTGWHVLTIIVAVASAGVLVAGALLVIDLVVAVTADRREAARARRRCSQCGAVELDPAADAWQRIMGGGQ